jgi:hypothetical protein
MGLGDGRPGRMVGNGRLLLGVGRDDRRWKVRRWMGLGDGRLGRMVGDGRLLLGVGRDGGRRWKVRSFN